jgi:hypothetical protein
MYEDENDDIHWAFGLVVICVALLLAGLLIWAGIEANNETTIAIIRGP